MTIIMFVIPASYTTLSVHSLGNLLKGAMTVTLYLSILSAISLMRDRRYKLLHSLPIGKNMFIFLYALVVFIKNYALRVMPIVLSVLTVSCHHDQLTFFQSVLAAIGFAIAGLAASLCGIGAIIFAYDRNYLQFKTRRSRIKFNWLKREFVRFASDKVIFINHVGYSLFIIFFIVNAIMVSDVTGGFLLFILSLLSTCSTPSVLFSYEKPYRNLLLTLPVSLKSLFWSKYGFSIAITLPLYAVAYTIVHISNPEMYKLDLLVLMLCSLGLTTFIKLYFDYKRPNDSWSHSRQMFEHKRKYKIWAMSMSVSVTWMLYLYVNLAAIIALQLLLTKVFLYVIKKEDPSQRILER